jgi:ABC-2 type transport system permease protein
MMNPFLHRTLALARKEVVHISRDVRVIYMALGMPVVLLFLFGYAVSFDLGRLPIGLLDRDQTTASRRLADAVTGSGSFYVKRVIFDDAEIETAFRRGEWKACLLIPRGFQRKLESREKAEAQFVLDGVDGVTTGISLGYAAGISQAETLRQIEGSGLNVRPPIDARVRLRFNPDMKSARFIVPGLIALILAILAVLLTALTVAREWERGNMEQLFTTPVGRLEVIIGKLSPYVVLGMMQVLLVVVVGTYLFDVPIRGSLWLLSGMAALFLICMMGQGLLISVLSRNQQVATQFGAVTSMLPTLLLSGFLFPIENMPWPLQVISSLVPARYFIVALRGILLKGNGISVLWPDALALFAFAFMMIALSTVRFKRRLD